MKQKKLTISVGTSAYNEGQNIKNMLRSVCSQNGKTIEIKEIIVISDGSTDKTVEMAKSAKDKRIKVMDDKKRMGQPSRMAQLLKMFTSDVFVLIDSDMVLKDKNTLENLVKPFIRDKNVSLVCGNTLPLPATTFLESAINNYRIVRESLEDEFAFGKTAYAAHAFLAYSKNFAKVLLVPKNVMNADAFSYFYAITRGYLVRYARNAVALYRSPQFIKDHINQATRHIMGGLQLKKYFGQETVDKGFAVPKAVLIRLMFLQVKKNPIEYLALKTLNFYCQYLSRKKNNFDPKWTTIESSKKLLQS